MLKITVIVPNYNYEQFLDECLGSVKKQSLTDFECIIVDDGSKDNSKEVIEKYVKEDKRFKVFYNTNHGLSYSRNFGIQHATSPLILPLDSDDYIEETYLERAVNTFEKFPQITLYYGKWMFLGHNADHLNNKLGNVRYVNYKTHLVGNLVHCSCVYRKEDALKCGLYRTDMQGYEDWDFLIRLLYKEKLVAYDPKVSFFYRKKDDSMINDSNKNYSNIFKTKVYPANKEIYDEYFDK